jgi:ribonuclease HI
MEQEIIMYTDGGSRGNPGPAGIGVWIETLNKKYAECIGEKTNNEAEYEALIFGLKKIKQLVGNAKMKNVSIKCLLDSELVVKQLNHEYRLKDERKHSSSSLSLI